ncbi:MULTISPECIES: GNAT family N-acetyltransferase [Bacillus cereus group]|uniref:GNAT family N-acetyltransferase n=1 Tax=Bacillus cereus TaxID=1396 RepID=A0AA44TD22_BACCE|nr:MULTISPECIES: GNAT family N-acetyltransferase [Bacillus cereus group]PFA23033.1 GNAT family N-acetyltransferase [Bacillus cereus]PFN04304.1 GNAT family N-acetyltransferase [Bacillus cereus]PFO81201.1 GNAT family N-acetyltransferase [Bacillus cereus]PFR21032.1 GNAT family N-acetyltransferase [Bacillus cereus]PFR96858.1 GNAT family N-acetyltransferase [Bacillus cereus]
MKVYEATIADLDGLADVFNNYRMFYRQKSNVEEAKVFLRNRIEREESIIFVAVENGQYLGFTQLYPSFSSISMKELWILNDLFVQEGNRGAGIGKKLLEAARTFALENGAKGLKLQTEIDNISAQRLYAENGYLRDSRYFHYELTF